VSHALLYMMVMLVRAEG